MDEELAELMRRAGCWMVAFGIESGEQALLDEVGKKATVEDAVAAVSVSKKARLKVAGHFVLGIPGETGESLYDFIVPLAMPKMRYCHQYSSLFRQRQSPATFQLIPGDKHLTVDAVGDNM